MSWRALLEDWKRHLQVHREPGTVVLYVGHMRRLGARHPDPLTVTRADIEQHLRSMNAPAYRASFLSACRQFYEWAILTGVVAVDPTRGIRGIRVPVRTGQPCEQDALDRAIAAADEDTRLMLLIGSLTALRAGEIARVNSRNVSYDGRWWLDVIGKGSKQRRVPLSPELAELITARKGWCFPSPVRPGAPICTHTVSRRVRAALGERTHSLRHYAATTAYEHTGGDILLVQQVLGHSTVSTTQRYIGMRDAAVHDGWTAAMERKRKQRLRSV